MAVEGDERVIAYEKKKKKRKEANEWSANWPRE